MDTHGHQEVGTSMNLLSIPPEPEDFALYEGEHRPDARGMTRGAVAFCLCGWHPKNHPGFNLGHHLRDMDPQSQLTSG